MFEWKKASEHQPTESKQYLTVRNSHGYQSLRVISFALDLSEVDPYEFRDEKRPGWYVWDDEYGYYETYISYWAEPPELPPYDEEA